MQKIHPVVSHALAAVVGFTAAALAVKTIKTAGPPAAPASLTQYLPDPQKTPGDVLPGVTAAQVCVPGYAARVRSVSASEKAAVYAAYGITSHSPGEYEVDHLVSLELAGSNSIANLWPQPYHAIWNARQKDVLENRLHAEVCSGKKTLPEAQAEIRTDWITAYQHEFATNQPLPVPDVPEKP